MAFKRVTPALLASLIAIAGLTSGILSGLTPAHAITSVDELTDVDPNHWAYNALKDLVEKYDVIEGYPSHVFKGEKFATRYELAAALYALIQTIGKDIARLDSEKLDKSDLDTIKALVDELRPELDALKARVTRLEERADANDAKNAEQDARISLLEKTRIHGDMTFGVLWDTNEPGARGRAGSTDGVAPVARIRLALDVPVVDGTPEGVLGEGTLRTRLIAAVGRNGSANNLNEGVAGLSRFAADSSSRNEWLGTGSANLRQNVYAEYAYYEQAINKIIPGQSDEYKTTATLYAGVIPWYRLFDRSEYRGVDRVDSFQNPAFNNIPGLPNNFVGAGAGFRAKQGLGSWGNLELTAAALSSDGNNWLNYQAATYELRYNHSFFDRVGSIYGGGYHLYNIGVDSVTATSGFPGQNPGTTNGFYVGLNQELYKGIGINVAGFLGDKNDIGLNNVFANQNYGYAGNATARLGRFGLTSVLSVPMSVFGVRERDTFGLGYAMVNFHNRVNDDANEHVVESFYNLAINDKVSLTPSVQFHFNRGGYEDNGFSTAVGLRTNIKF